MTGVTIRPFRGQDEPALLQLWNRALALDPIDEAAFRTRVLLDLNFSPQGLLVAEQESRLVGFVLSIARQVPLFLQGLEPERAWITVFGGAPEARRLARRPRRQRCFAASRTSSACPLTLTLRQMRAMRPSAPIRKVARSTPM